MGIRQRRGFVPVVAKVIASLALVVMGGTALLTVTGAPAGAVPSVACSTTVSTLNVQVSAGLTSDQLYVGVVSGNWSIAFDTTPVCTGGTYPVGPSGFSTVVVGEGSSVSVPTTFQPNGADGLNFVGAAGVPNTLNLGTGPAGTVIDVNGGQLVQGSGTDAFSNITTFKGSSLGSTTFRLTGDGGAGGYTFIGWGPYASNTLDLGGLTLPVTMDYSLSLPRLTLGPRFDYLGAGTIGGLIGSPFGTQVTVGSAGGYHFVGGTSPTPITNTLDLSQLTGPTTSVDLTLNPGQVTVPGGTDTVTGFNFFVGSNVGDNTFKANGTGGYTFEGGSGTNNVLDFSGVTGHPTVTRGSSCTSPGTISGLLPGVGGSTVDRFCELRLAGLLEENPATGYRLLSNTGGIFAYGLSYYGSPAGLGDHATNFVGLAQTRLGYWAVTNQGAVYSFGVKFWGSCFEAKSGCLGMNNIVGIAPTHDGCGYWLATSTGNIYSFGDAKFHGSLGALRVTVHNIVGIESPDSGGYWLVGSDGGIFAFGDAPFHGSTGSLKLSKPIVGIASPDRNGYLLVASDGGIFTFGDARYAGSCPQAGSSCHSVVKLSVVGATSADAGGYWLEGENGAVYTFGDAKNVGSGFSGTLFGGMVAIK